MDIAKESAVDQRNDPSEGQRTGERERGSALVAVMLFGVVASMLIATLLTSTTSNLNAEFQTHEKKALDVVLRTAMEHSIYEINRNLLAGPYDPDGDGAGALGTNTGPTPKNGIEVRGANNRLLGLYRTVVKQDPEGTVIYAVAVTPRDSKNPTFVNPIRRIAAKLLVGPQNLTLSPTSALEFPGAAPDKAKFEVKKDSNLQVLSGAPLDGGVPSIKIANPGFHDAFVTAYNTGAKVDGIEIKDKGDFILAGKDKNNPGSTTTGTDSMENGNSGVFTEATLQSLAEGAQEYVDAKADAAFANPLKTTLNAWLLANAGGDYTGNGTEDAKLNGSANLTLPDGVYEVKDLKLEDNATLTGSGTLIVTKKLEIKDSSQLNWTGDIIVLDNENDKKGEIKVKGGSIQGSGDILAAGKVKVGDANDPTNTPVLDWSGNVIVVSNQHKDHFHKAEFKLEKDGVMNVDGTLAVIGWDKEAKFEVKKEGILNVDGAVMVLAGQDPGGEEDEKSKAKFKLDKEGTINVNGVLAMLGTEVKFEVKKDETLNVTGSTVIGITEAKKSKLKFKVDKDSNVSLVHNSGNVVNAANDLNSLQDDIISLLGANAVIRPVSRNAYWDDTDAKSVFDQQQAAIDAGDAGYPSAP